jgi:hypothetical protein
MPVTYKTRRKCNTEDTNSVAGDPGHGKGWHYIYTDQTTVDETEACPDHPSSEIEHFVVLREVVTE